MTFKLRRHCQSWTTNEATLPLPSLETTGRAVCVMLLTALSMESTLDRGAETPGKTYDSLATALPRNLSFPHREELMKPSSLPESDHDGEVPDLSNRLSKGKFIGSGSFGDVYQGVWNGGNHCCDYPTVAIKVMRAHALRNDKGIAKRDKRFMREIRVWKELRHKNILPLIGKLYIDGDPNQPAIVSPWMSNGTLVEYINDYPNSNRESFMIEILEGLNYLHCILAHNPPRIHGDLKAANVLVDDNGRIFISDFGLSVMLEDTTLWNTSATHAPGSVRWMAPELLHATETRITKEADVYAYAMTCYEIWSGNVPFHGLRDGAVMMAVAVRNERPPRTLMPQASDNTWKIINDCWTTDPRQRPLTETVIHRLSANAPEQLSARNTHSTQLPTSFIRVHAVKVAGFVKSLAASPCCRNVAIVSNAQNVLIMDYTSGKSFPIAETSSNLNVVRFSPDGSLLGAAGKTFVQAWKCKGYNQYESTSPPFEFDWEGLGHHNGQFVSFSSDLLSLPLLGETHQVSFRDATTGLQRELPIPLPGAMDMFAMSRFGVMYAACDIVTSSPAVVYDTRSRRTFPLDHPESFPWSIKFSPDGHHIAVGYLDGSLVVWETNTFTKAWTRKLHARRVVSLAFSFDARMIATGSADETVCIIDVQTGEIIGSPLEGFNADVTCMAFSFDGEYLVAGSERVSGENLLIWRAE